MLFYMLQANSSIQPAAIAPAQQSLLSRVRLVLDPRGGDLVECLVEPLRAGGFEVVVEKFASDSVYAPDELVLYSVGCLTCRIAEDFDHDSLRRVHSAVTAAGGRLHMLVRQMSGWYADAEDLQHSTEETMSETLPGCNVPVHVVRTNRHRQPFGEDMQFLVSRLSSVVERREQPVNPPQQQP